MEKVRNDVYSLEQWEKDGSFNAEAGQQISGDIYERFLNCMHPLTLPSGKAEQALHDYGVPVHAGFLMGEPRGTNEDGRSLYPAFGTNNFGKGSKYFYLGLSIAEQPIKNGTYYVFDCLNAFIADKLFPVKEFNGDADAIQTAANYEADLYKCTFKAGECTSRKVLHEAWAAMN